MIAASKARYSSYSAEPTRMIECRSGRMPRSIHLRRPNIHYFGQQTYQDLQSDSWRSFDLAAARPSFSVLTSERGIVMPNLEDALARYVAAM